MTASGEKLARDRARAVKAEAARLGFQAYGIAAADNVDPENRLGHWIALGYHGDMAWMARDPEVRRDVRRKLQGARSVVVVARNYYAERPDGGPSQTKTGRVSRYAWGRDYHEVLAEPIRALGRFIETIEEGARSYGSVDTGPVLERAWAARAGVGWIGKHGLVLRRDLGSWFFLGTVATTVALAADGPAKAYCGQCTRCIEACPTGAIVAPGVVDARRCVSYLTVEHRGEIPKDLAPGMGDWIFGCDVCQEVCPWNRFARTTNETFFLPLPGHACLDPEAVDRMDETTFREAFAGTPLLRAKLSGLRRNLRSIRDR